jgi:hypothetical protein
MPRAITRPTCFRPFRYWLAPLCAALLTACGGGGGGGGDDDNGNGGGTAPASGVPAMVGEWVHKTCSPVGSDSGRILVSITQTGTSTAAYHQGMVQYTGAGCSGTGTATQTRLLANVQINTIRTATGIAAHWGQWTGINSVVSPVVWSKLSENEWCQVSDQSPSVFPDATSVLNYLNLNRNGACYDRR